MLGLTGIEQAKIEKNKQNPPQKMKIMASPNQINQLKHCCPKELCHSIRHAREKLILAVNVTLEIRIGENKKKIDFCSIQGLFIFRLDCFWGTLEY